MKTSRRRFLRYSTTVALGTVLGLELNSCSGKKITRSEIDKEMNELVDEYLPVYGTCSQTSFHALNKAFDLKSDKFIRALAPFPGVAMRGETCGAVTGCLCAISLVYEEEKPGNKLSDKPSLEFCHRFENEFGSTRCRDVIIHMTSKEYSILKPEDYQVLISEGALGHCDEVIKNAIGIAADIISENE